MNQPRLGLVHQMRPPRAAAAGRPPALILLHGIGADEFDLLDLAGELDPRFLVVSARAPHEWGPGFAWFSIEIADDGLRMDLDQAEASIAALSDFVEACVRAHGCDPARVYLAGFSQGAMMAAAVALARPGLAAGVVMMSGSAEALGVLQTPGVYPDFLVVHGTYDPVLPVSAGRAARDALTALGARVSYREYPMAHQISQASLTDVAVWLSERLDAPHPPQR